MLNIAPSIGSMIGMIFPGIYLDKTCKISDVAFVC